MVTASTKWAGVYKAVATPHSGDGEAADEGGAEHIGLDHLPHVSAFVADWVTDTFAEPPSPGG